MTGLPGFKQSFKGDTPDDEGYTQTFARWSANTERNAHIVPFVKDTNDVVYSSTATGHCMRQEPEYPAAKNAVLVELGMKVLGHDYCTCNLFFPTCLNPSFPYTIMAHNNLM
jgi:hypothetical protein